jgi:hypothetical protein
VSGVQIAAVALSGVYGLGTAFAGITGLAAKDPSVNRATALRTLAGGLLLIAASVALWFDPGTTAFALVLVALLNAHIMALANGVAMKGRITPSHHLTRLVVSLVIGVLTYLAI